MTKGRPLPASGLILFLAAAVAAAAQPQTRPKGGGTRLGLRADYFSQEMSWDNLGQKSASDLNSALVAAVLEFRVGRDSSASLFAGYCSSDISGLMFRGLPFSIDYEAGGTGGLALGADLDFSLTPGSRVRVSARGEVTGYLGQSQKWDIPGLAVTGSLEGKTIWLRARVGPQLAFGGEGRLTPYIFPFFHYIWGSLEMRESIESLSGKETKDIRSQSYFGVAAGLDIPLSPGVKLKAEAGIYPGSGSAGYSATLATMFSF